MHIQYTHISLKRTSGFHNYFYGTLARVKFEFVKARASYTVKVGGLQAFVLPTKETSVEVWKVPDDGFSLILKTIF